MFCLALLERSESLLQVACENEKYVTRRTIEHGCLIELPREKRDEYVRRYHSILFAKFT